MNPMRFRLRANGKEMPLIIPADHVESAILPSAEHEAGHITAAHHLNARVRGIAVGVVSNDTQGQWVLQAVYSWKGSTVEDKCVAKAAGVAADLFFHGGFDKEGGQEGSGGYPAPLGRDVVRPLFGASQKDHCA